MTTLLLRFEHSLPDSASRVRRFGWDTRPLSLSEVRYLLITLAALLCLLVCAPIAHPPQSLDERAMLSAMLAAGGMPLVYSPPALCTATRAPARLTGAEIGAMIGSPR